MTHNGKKITSTENVQREVLIILKPKELEVFTSQFLSFGSSFYALPPSLSVKMKSATFLTFLPVKLEPLGFSLTGQFCVAS